MTYAEGRTYYDADSHLMELSGWLAEYADPDVRDELRPLALGGAGALADEAVRTGTVLPPRYRTYYRVWFVLGWPAFAGVIAIFALMLWKPQ